MLPRFVTDSVRSDQLLTNTLVCIYIYIYIMCITIYIYIYIYCYHAASIRHRFGSIGPTVDQHISMYIYIYIYIMCITIYIYILLSCCPDSSQIRFDRTNC